MLLFSSNFSPYSFELVFREINAMLMNKFDKFVNRNSAFSFAVDRVDNLCELETVISDELFSNLFDSSVVLYLFFKNFSNFPLTVIFQ